MAFVPIAETMFRNHENTHYPTSSSCAPHDYQDMSQFVMRGSISYSGIDRAEELQPDDEMSTDEGSQLMLGEKKRRLNIAQVKALEKSFELGNKLEPERKIQLARALGLQPRQISIWFQNRRARWKIKQLERDYDNLKRQFEGLKADNNTLKSQNKKLQSQLWDLKSRDSTGPVNLKKERECFWSENNCDDVNLNSTTLATDNTLYLHSSHKKGVVFPTTTDGTVAVNLTQFLHSSSRPDLQLSHKIDQASGSNEGYYNMFGTGIHEENPEFWPWSEQRNFT